MRYLSIIAIGLLMQPVFGQDNSEQASIDLRASVHVHKHEAYVKEQILLTIKTAIPQNAFNLTYSDLKIDDVELISLHRKEYSDSVDGISWQIVERNFALFANTPGSINIPAMRFRATLPVTQGDLSRNGNPELKATVPEQEIRIKPAPESATPWLTATDVRLSARWGGPDNTSTGIQLRHGEPRTRTISVQITNQHPAAIAPVIAALPDAIQSYPDQPQFEVQLDAAGVGGRMIQSTALVAGETGTFVLPELSLRWWHSDEGVWKVSTLAAEQIDVVASASGVEQQADAVDRYRDATLALGALVLLLAAIIVGLMVRLNRHSQASTRSESTPPASEQAAWSTLLTAIARRDLSNVRTALLDWHKLRVSSSSANRLDQIAPDNPALQNMLQNLDRRLYRAGDDESSDVSSAELAQLKSALTEMRKRETLRSRTLPPRTRLYPLE